MSYPYQGVDSISLGAPVIEAIKELKNDNRALKALRERDVTEIVALKTEIQALKEHLLL